MNYGLERILTLTFGAEGNEINHLGDGWSGNEPNERWMVGSKSELWLEHPGTDHDLVLELEVGVLGAAPGAEGQRLMLSVRNEHVTEIVAHRGGRLGFHIPASMLTGLGPVRLLFDHPDFRRPVDVGRGNDGRQLSYSLRRLELFRVLPRSPAGNITLPPPDQMIGQFESLGDNCEFGLVQRELGAEPLGLLRFSYIELPMLLLGLHSGFVGLGEPHTTKVSVEGEDREFIVRESVYWITYHTFQCEHQISAGKVRQEQAKRLNFLKQKLMADIVAGEKIFVIRRFPDLRLEEVLPVYTALNERGQNWLLWVVSADAAHPPGTVEKMLPGLLRGRLDRLLPPENVLDFSVKGWTVLCEAAWRAARC